MPEENFDLINQEILETFRHGNVNTAIIQRVSDKKFFKLDYRDSIKDEMDFEECNYGDFTLKEVFPKEITITIYE